MLEREAERRFGRNVLLLVALGFLGVLAAGVSAGLVMMRSQDQTGWIAHTYEVERHVGAIRLELERMRSARRGALLGLRTQTADQYAQASRTLFREIDRVASLTSDNPVQQRNVAELRRLARDVDRLLSRSMTPGSVVSGSSEAERQEAATAVQRLAEAMLAEEGRLLTLRDARQAASVRTFYIVLFVMAVLLVMVAAGSVWVIRRYSHDLGKSRDALRRLNANLEAAVEERTTDLQRANEEIQRFAYIVSHDLRSPLVNVMGFTSELEAAARPLAALVERVAALAPELADEEARRAVEEDLPEAVNFIRGSTQKMDRLINAILRLSREGRRPIVPEQLDMDALAQGVVDSLRHRIDALGAEVRIEGPLPGIVNDRLAIEQILSNLVENAVKYLQPGRRGLIRISARRQQHRVILEVADNGRGIEPRDQQRIFDLFRRAGAQDQPGEGIGLAHARALTYRLGGTIGVDSQPDQGAVFSINLPAMFAGERKGREAA